MSQNHRSCVVLSDRKPAAMWKLRRNESAGFLHVVDVQSFYKCLTLLALQFRSLRDSTRCDVGNIHIDFLWRNGQSLGRFAAQKFCVVLRLFTCSRRNKFLCPAQCSLWLVVDSRWFFEIFWGKLRPGHSQWKSHCFQLGLQHCWRGILRQGQILQLQNWWETPVFHLFAVNLTAWYPTHSNVPKYWPWVSNPQFCFWAVAVLPCRSLVRVFQVRSWTDETALFESRTSGRPGENSSKRGSSERLATDAQEGAAVSRWSICWRRSQCVPKAPTKIWWQWQPTPENHERLRLVTLRNLENKFLMPFFVDICFTCVGATS